MQAISFTIALIVFITGMSILFFIVAAMENLMTTSYEDMARKIGKKYY